MKQVSKGWKGLNITSRICGATLLAAFTATAFGHNNEPNPTDKPLVWVDNDGKVIGRATTTKFGGSAVQVRTRGLSLIVPIANITNATCTQPFVCETSRTVTWGSEIVYFSDADCGGTPYVGAFNLTPGSDRALGVRGRTLYVGNDSLKSTLLKSYKSASISATECLNTPAPPPGAEPSQANVWAVKYRVDLLTLGKPPFYLK
jgi:hypothetical protein